MPSFLYEALTSEGSVTRGAMVADSEADVEAAIRERGDFLIDARPGQPADAAMKPRVTDGSVPRRDLLAFTEYLWGSARAGLPILGTLEEVGAQVESKRMRRIVDEIHSAMVDEGKSLSEALAEHPKAFPPLFSTTIEAGETTGRLDYALEQLVDYLEWNREISLQIRQATVYPAIVLLVMTGLILLLLAYVYPRLLPIFTGYGMELPLMTRAVLSAGEAVQAYWRHAAIAFAGVGLALIVVGRTARGRLAMDGMKLRIPIFGPLVHQIEMARVVTYMALFYRTGVELIRAFTLLERMTENRRVAMAIGDARRAVSAGQSMAGAMARTGLFPSIVVRGFALGETTGALDDSLERARAYYAREVPSAVKRMLAALQPALIVVLGALLGIIAMSIFLPVMNIYQSVGR